MYMQVYNIDILTTLWTFEQIAVIEITLKKRKKKTIITEDCQRTDLFCAAQSEIYLLIASISF